MNTLRLLLLPSLLLILLPNSAWSQPNPPAYDFLKPLLPDDAHNARLSLAKVVGEELADGFSIVHTDCPFFETCTDVVRREIAFERLLSTIRPDIHLVSRTNCYGIKEKNWHCYKPFEAVRFKTAEGNHHVLQRDNLSPELIARILEYLRSDCYEKAFMSQPQLRKFGFQEGKKQPTYIKARKPDGYYVSLGYGSHIELVIADSPDRISGCDLTLVNGYWRLVRP